MSRGRLLPDGLRVVVLHGLTGSRIEAGGDLGEPDFEEIRELSHRAHRGAGGLYGVRLLNGDGWPDVFDGVDFGFVEELEELARVSGKRLDVAALALGVEGVEDEGRFAGATEAGDRDVAAQRDIEIEALKIVLADAAETDALRGGTRGGDGSSGEFFNHGNARMST